MSDKSKLLAKREEICRANRTGQYIDTHPDIADSGLRLYERKLELYQCRSCDNRAEYEEKYYCLLSKGEYEDV